MLDDPKKIFSQIRNAGSDKMKLNIGTHLRTQQGRVALRCPVHKGRMEKPPLSGDTCGPGLGTSRS